MSLVSRVVALFRRSDVPVGQLGRTGDARYIPQMSGGRDGRGRYLAPRRDTVSIADYDRVRFYPIVRDSLKLLTLPVRRANFHFACGDQELAELAAQELTMPVRRLLEHLVKSGYEFGYGAAEKVWEPVFDLRVASGQSGSGSEETVWPVAWRIRRWAVYSPADTRILARPHTGAFAGIRQFVSTANADVPAERLVHWAYDGDFGGNYGTPRTKAAVPFVELAESIYDDIAQYSRRFAVPWTLGRHKPGFTALGRESGDLIRRENAELMHELIEGLKSGQSVTIPAEFDPNTGNPLWDIQVVQASGEQKYIDLLTHVNDMIRTALVVPQMASSQAPDTGTYNLGETQIELFLENVGATLDSLEEALNEQLLEDFRRFNRPDAPPLTIVFEPLDVKARRALLAALLGLLQSGVPLESGDGESLAPDWAAIAQDAGLPLRVRSLEDRSMALREALMRRLEGGGDEAAPGARGVAPAEPGRATASRGVASPGSGDGEESFEEGEDRAELSETSPARGSGSGDWREEDHPRGEDGKFGDKPGDGADEEPDGEPEGSPATEDGRWRPKDREENVQRGRESVRRVLESGEDVADAMYREDIGHIDFRYGEKGDSSREFRGGSGISHIVAKRSAMGDDPEAVLERMVQLIATGSLRVETEGRGRVKLIIQDEGHAVVLSPDYNGQARNWVLTAYSRESDRR